MSAADKKYVCTLSAELLERAKKELNEDPKTRHLEIKTLRERLDKVPGFKGRLDDAFLLRFLRAKKFDQERAFSQVLTYYRMRKENPDIYENLTPRRIQHLLDGGLIGVLKDRAPDGSRIIIFRPGKWDPDTSPLADVLGAMFLTLCKLMEEEETQVCGVMLLPDLGDFGWHQARHFSPQFARRITTLVQEAFPMRFKGIHYVREPPFFDVVFAIIKQFWKEKMLKRIHLYGDNLEKLHENIPPEILPEDFGGRLPAFSNTEWTEKLLECEAQFAEDNKFGLLDMTIPAKQEKKQDATESLGGTFRKLNVD